MDRRILDEEIVRRVDRARATIAEFQRRLAENGEEALVWYLEDAFTSYAREGAYLVAVNLLRGNTVSDSANLLSGELVRMAQRFEASTSVGRNVSDRCHVLALAEVLELLQQAVPKDVDQAA